MNSVPLIPVIPAQAGIQRFQSLALGPRFRGGDDLVGRRHFFTRSKAGIQDGDDFGPLPGTPAFAGVTGIILI